MKYKEFEYILSSFACDKNCPYCTAKITRWPLVEDRQDRLLSALNCLKDKDVHFRYFIMSGNGEPSLHSIGKLREIGEVVAGSGMFDELRFQTSGNLFYCPDKLDAMISFGFMPEITRVALDSSADMRVLGYARDYINSPGFARAPKVRLNFVLTKGREFSDMVCGIRKYVDTYRNIATVSLKTLNCDTSERGISDVRTKWIAEHGYTKEDAPMIISEFNRCARLVRQDKLFFDRVEWDMDGVPVTFYTKEHQYGQSNVVFYGGKMVNYRLEDLDPDLL